MIQCGLVGHHTAKYKVMGSISSQGTCLGCRFSPWSECVRKATHISVSLHLLLPPFSLKINKISLAGVAQWIECWPVN